MAKIVSVVVPCFNEAERIIPVINTLKKSPSISEIIVVDDGSTPQNAKILRSLKGVKLVTHRRNQGKTAALKTGVLNAHSGIVAFVDADLTGFTVRDFESLVAPVANNTADIAISHRGREPFYGQISQFAIAYTGERVVSRKLLTDNLDIFDVKNYLFEPIFNQRFFGRYRLAVVYLPNVGQYQQAQKRGARGWLVNLKQVVAFIKFLGPFQFFFQLAFVSRQPRQAVS